MTRETIEKKIIAIFEAQFEIVNPSLEADLREAYEFDSIDAIELLREIEIMLDMPLSQEEKKSAMGIRTISHIVDYVERILKEKTQAAASSN
jgi:acyl carrier protein